MVPGSAKANGRETNSWLGRVLHFKSASFSVMKEVHGTNARPYLRVKTRPRFCPDSLSFPTEVGSL
jgi:hypothetical protein